jgi:hypothetical protein
MLQVSAEYDRDTSQQILINIARQLTASLLSVSAGTYRRAVVVETGMTKTQMGIHNRSENDRSA